SGGRGRVLGVLGGTGHSATRASRRPNVRWRSPGRVRGIGQYGRGSWRRGPSEEPTEGSDVSHAGGFGDVSTTGVEWSPVAPALAGLRANEARYFKNKYDHVFTVEPAAKAKKTIDLVSRVLKEERDIVIASPALEATTFQVEDIRWSYVFYESGLSIN